MWMYTVNIVRFLGQWPTKPLSIVGPLVIEELKKAPPFSNEEGKQLISRLQDAITCDNVGEFDDVLADVYDFADTIRVWLGSASHAS